MLTVPKKIGGLTTFCHKKYLDSFLVNQNRTVKQPFELYEGPPEFLPANSPVFIFQAGINHRLRGIARFIGYLDINGWRKPGHIVANQLLNLYKKEGIVSHDTKNELAAFCAKQDGVRGLFVFDRIIEVKYSSKRDWIKKIDVTRLFMGKTPYARGFPCRYLSEEMVSKLANMILQKAENSTEIKKFFQRNFS